MLMEINNNLYEHQIWDILLFMEQKMNYLL